LNTISSVIALLQNFTTGQARMRACSRPGKSLPSGRDATGAVAIAASPLPSGRASQRSPSPPQCPVKTGSTTGTSRASSNCQRTASLYSVRKSTLLHAHRET
jgi:hypothetical protein